MMFCTLNFLILTYLFFYCFFKEDVTKFPYNYLTVRCKINPNSPSLYYASEIFSIYSVLWLVNFRWFFLNIPIPLFTLGFKTKMFYYHVEFIIQRKLIYFLYDYVRIREIKIRNTLFILLQQG